MSSLTWLRGNRNIDAEFAEIEDAVTAMQQFDAEQRFSPTDLFTDPRIFRPFLLSIALMFFQQASGVNAVIFYTSQIFRDAGFSSDPNTPTMIVGAVLVFSTLVSCIIADIAGRRILLLLSGTLMTTSIAVLGIYFYLTEKRQVCLSVSLFLCLCVSMWVQS